MGKELLIEIMQVPFTILSEATAKNGGRMEVEGIFGACNEINGNGRVYPEKVQDREINKLKPLIQERCVYCEADHPDDGKSRIRFTAAMPTSLDKQTINGRVVYLGRATILNTEQGRNIQEIIRAGGKIGVSQRGWGSLVKGTWNGQPAEIVQEDYTLKTFDFVIGQSTKGAEVGGISEQMNVVNLIEVGPCENCKNNGMGKDLKGGTDSMDIKTIEELRKAYPALCDQLVSEAMAAKEKEIKEAMQKEFDARVLKEVEAKTEEVKNQVIEEIKNSEDFKAMSGTLVEIGKLVRPYLSKGDLEEEDALAEEVAGLKVKVAALEDENKALKEQKESERKAAEIKDKVQKRIKEVTAGKKHEAVLVEALSDCKTVEEVDAKVAKEEAMINKLLNEQGKPPITEDIRGKGKQLDENKTTPEETDKRKQRERQLAGLA